MVHTPNELKDKYLNLLKEAEEGAILPAFLNGFIEGIDAVLGPDAVSELLELKAPLVIAVDFTRNTIKGNSDNKNRSRE